MFFPPPNPHLSQDAFFVALGLIIAARRSLVAYYLASREYSELGCRFYPSYKRAETRIPS
jgi:hypothetical protein